MLILFTGLIIIEAQSTEEPKGKILFKENKCISCHAIETQGFVKKGKSTAPDLSNVGAERTVEWLKNMLQRKKH